MKSVESMLPKNMNMKHVLLAVLVGLLLCMLMGQGVEGMKNIAGTDAITGAGAENGICMTSLGGAPKQSCIPKQYGQGNTLTAAKTAAGNHPVVSGATPTRALSPQSLSAVQSICGKFTESECELANSESTNTSIKTRIESGIRQHNAGQTDDKTKIGYDAKKSGKSKVYASNFISCKLQEDDVCKGLQDADGCTSQDMCDWTRCGSHLGDKMPHFGPKSAKPGANPEIDLEGSHFDTWKHCLFTRNYGVSDVDATGTPTFSTTNTGLLKATYPLKAPVKTGVTTVNDLRVLTAASGSTNAIDTSGKLSKGKVPGNSDNTDATGLTGWYKGEPGVARGKYLKDRAFTADELKQRNAIPLTKDGTVSSDVADYLPGNLKQGIENMVKWCQYGLSNEALKKDSAGTDITGKGVTYKNNIAVGWNDDRTSLKCLNYNPNISSYTTQGHKPKFDCVSSKQKCFYKEGPTSGPTAEHTACIGPNDGCYSFNEPNFAMVATAPDADKLDAATGLIKAGPSIAVNQFKKGVATAAAAVGPPSNPSM